MLFAAEITGRLDRMAVGLKDTVPGLSTKEKSFIRGLNATQRDALAQMILARSHAIGNGSSDYKERILDRCDGWRPVFAQARRALAWRGL